MNKVMALAMAAAFTLASAGMSADASVSYWAWFAKDKVGMDRQASEVPAWHPDSELCDYISTGSFSMILGAKIAPGEQAVMHVDLGRNGIIDTETPATQIDPPLSEFTPNNWRTIYAATFVPPGRHTAYLTAGPTGRVNVDRLVGDSCIFVPKTPTN